MVFLYHMYTKPQLKCRKLSREVFFLFAGLKVLPLNYVKPFFVQHFFALLYNRLILTAETNIFYQPSCSYFGCIKQTKPNQLTGTLRY